MTDGEYTVEIAVMRFMGWDWHGLLAAPAMMVDEVGALMEATALVERARESERRRT